jgi:hypothetical protein
MKHILIFILSTLFLTNCGGGGSSSTSGSNQDVDMVIGQAYTAYSGNKIIKNDEETIIQVTHFDANSESTVVLVEGNATIIRNP